MKTIQEIEQYINDAGSDSTDVFGGKFRGGYLSQQCPEELSLFIHYLQNKNIKNYLEIDAATLGTTRIMNELLNLENITVIDIGIPEKLSGNDVETIMLSFEENKKHLPNLTYITCDSLSELAREELYKLNIRYDLVLIDSIHTYNHCLNDINLSIPHRNNKFYLSFHDSNLSDIDACIKDISKILLPKDTQKFSTGKNLGITCLEF